MALLSDQLKTARDKIAELEKQPRGGGGSAAPFIVGLPVDLKAKEAGRRLLAIPVPAGAKPELEVFGLTSGLKASAKGARVTLADERPAGFRAELEIADGVVALTGENLDRYPRLGLAVVRVALGPGHADAYYHFSGTEQKAVSGKMTPLGLADTDFKFTYDPPDAAKLGAAGGQLKLGAVAKVRFFLRDKAAEEYVLFPDENDAALVNARVDPLRSPAIKLTLQKDGRVVLDVKYPFAVKDNPTCQVLSADVIRVVTILSGERAPRELRQEVVRIRP